MNEYLIVTDSCSDLPLNFINKYEIKVFAMTYILDNKSYKNYPDHSELSFNIFYDNLKNGSVGTTSQISPNDFINFFTPYLEQGSDILYIGFSSALSGTYNSSLIAKEELLEKYPERKIICIDSLTASTSEGKFVLEACFNKEKGLSIEDNAKDLEMKKLNLAAYFTVDDLNTLKRGGRLSATSAFLGSILGIKPVLHVDNDGKLVPTNKCRGRKNAFNTLISYLKDNILDKENDLVFISHANCEEDAKMIKNTLTNEVGVKNIELSLIGPVISLHSGPGTILITYFSKKR